MGKSSPGHLPLLTDLSLPFSFPYNSFAYTTITVQCKMPPIINYKAFEEITIFLDLVAGSNTETWIFFFFLMKKQGIKFYFKECFGKTHNKLNGFASLT